MSVEVAPATGSDLDQLVEVAAQTFALACEPDAPAEVLAAHIAEHLSAARFAAYLADPDRVVLVARDGPILGYAMVAQGVPDEPDLQAAVTVLPTVELSKIYVRLDRHGTAVAPALMAAAIDTARSRAAASMWLGTNANNLRAQRFYRKHGFAVTGTRVFRLGSTTEQDVVMTRGL